MRFARIPKNINHFSGTVLSRPSMPLPPRAKEGGLSCKELQPSQSLKNLLGNRAFCPITRKTPSLVHYLQSDIPEKANTLISQVREDILHRAAAFILLKDSKASFSIEGESPKGRRAALWVDALGQAGIKQMSRQ